MKWFRVVTKTEKKMTTSSGKTVDLASVSNRIFRKIAFRVPWGYLVALFDTDFLCWFGIELNWAYAYPLFGLHIGPIYLGLSVHKKETL